MPDIGTNTISQVNSVYDGKRKIVIYVSAIEPDFSVPSEYFTKTKNLFAASSTKNVALLLSVGRLVLPLLSTNVVNCPTEAFPFASMSG
jgi:hypothetical protein